MIFHKDNMMDTNRTMVSTGTGARPPRQTSRDISCSPVHFDQIDRSRFFQRTHVVSENFSSAKDRHDKINRSR